MLPALPTRVVAGRACRKFLPAARPCCAPGGDLFAHGAVERTKILVDREEVRQQFARGDGHLQQALTHLGWLHQIDPPLPDLLDFGIDLGFFLLQFGAARAWIEFRAFNDLVKQVEYRQQPRFGTDETALAQALQPSQRGFG